jgi:hypothetical protein
MTKDGLDVLESINEWFVKARPKVSMDTFRVQLGVHFEEVAEMLEQLKGTDRLTQSMLTTALVANHALAIHLKNTKCQVIVLDRKELLDALCDQIVTAAGVAHEQNLDLFGGTNEVDDSNWSKYVDGEPTFDTNGKIAKGPDYRKAELEPFVGPNPNY